MNLNKLFKKEVEKSKKEKMKEIVSALKEATPIDTGAARDGWTCDQNSIMNDVEYVDALNSGSSQQAPKHFIEKTLLSFSGIKPKGSIL
jgi:hypothetical protein